MQKRAPAPSVEERSCGQLNLTEEGTVTRQDQSEAVVEWMQATLGEEEDLLARTVGAEIHTEVPPIRRTPDY